MVSTVAWYIGLEVAVVSPAATAPCEDIHLSRNTNNISALEADHKLDSPYPRAQLSDTGAI